MRSMLILALLVVTPVVSASHPELDGLIEHAEQLNVNAPQPQAEMAIGRLLERLDEANDRQRARIRIMHARNLALGGDFHRAMGILKRLLETDLDTDHRLRTLTLKANLGFRVGHYHDAFRALQQALDLTPEVSNQGYLARLYSLASHWYREVGEVDRSIAAADRARRLAHETGKPRETCIAFEKIGLAYETGGELEAALETYKEALEACQVAGDPVYEGAVMIELGRMQHKKGHFSPAEEWLTEGIKLTREAGFTDGLLRGKVSYGHLLFDQQRLDRAQQMLLEAVENIQTDRHWRALADASKLLYRIFTQKGEYHRAYDYLAKHHDAHERLLESQRTRLVAFHEVQFDAEAKDRELQLLRSRAEADALESRTRRQNRTIQIIGYSLTGILFLILVLLLIHAARERHHYRSLSRHDGLTRLPNHTYFLEAADSIMSKCRQAGKPMTLVLADVDHFKRVNDRNGHLAGDEVLRRIAARMREVFAIHGIVGRLGGEEFGIALPGTDADQAKNLIEEFRKRLRETRSDDRPISVTLSFGLAEHEDEQPIDELRDRADLALYHAKRAGRDRFMEAGARSN